MAAVDISPDPGRPILRNADRIAYPPYLLPTKRSPTAGKAEQAEPITEHEIGSRGDPFPWLVEAAGIELYAALFEKRWRRATFVVNSKKSNGLLSSSC